MPELSSDAGNTEWRSQGPAMLSQYQEVDYARLGTFKEVCFRVHIFAITSLISSQLFITFETLQNDLGREQMENAERSLGHILNWEVEQELMDFVSRMGFKTDEGREPGAQLGRTSSISSGAPGGSLAGADARSLRTNGRAPSVFTSSDKEKSKSSGLFSAFKIGKNDKSKGNNEKIRPEQQQRSQSYRNGDTAENTADAPISGDSLNPRDQEQYGRIDTDSDQLSEIPVRPASTSRKSNRDSFMRSFPSMSLKRKPTVAGRGDKGVQNASSRQQAFSARAPMASPDMLTPPAANPTSGERIGSANPFGASMRARGTGTPTVEQVSAFGGEDIPAAASENVDEQGYSLPPKDYNRPIGGGENLIDMPDSDEEWVQCYRNWSYMKVADVSMNLRSETPQGMRVNIQPAATARKEDDDASDAALLRMKNTLSQGLTPSPSGFNRRGTRTTRSGRQSTIGPITPTASPPLNSPSDDVPIATILERHKQNNGASNPTPLGLASPTPLGLASPTPLGLASPTGMPAASRSPPARTGSVLSTSSSQQNLVNAASNPFGSSGTPGFRASILETVNVLFQAGQVVRVLVTGEIGLSLRDISVDGPLRIKIVNPQLIGRSAPNNAILSPVDDFSGEGEFIVNTSALLASDAPVTTVFKYQLKTEESDEKAFVPVEVHPQWKIEPHQTSFVMTYHGNPSCQFATSEESPFGADEGDSSSTPLLHDVSFTVPVVSGCKDMQTKPLGSYSAEKKRILWKMHDLDISSSRAAKILARFQTESEGMQQPVTIQWRLPGRLASGVSLEVLSSAGVALDEIVRATQSGKYIAQP